MSYNAFEQEKTAAMTELNEQELTNLVGGTSLYDGDLIDLDLYLNDILNNNDVDVLTINPIVGLLSTLLGNRT